jgi:hypothetical protein
LPSVIDITDIKNAGKLPSHGRGPRFDPLCAHH